MGGAECRLFVMKFRIAAIRAVNANDSFAHCDHLGWRKTKI